MGVYDIQGVFSNKMLDRFLAIFENFLNNTIKFIIKVYNWVEYTIYDFYDYNLINHPVTIVLVTIGIILLCNLISKKLNEIQYLENLNTSDNFVQESELKLYKYQVDNFKNNSEDNNEHDDNINMDSNENIDEDHHEDHHEDYHEDYQDENPDDESNYFEDNPEYLKKYNFIKKNAEMIEIVDDTAGYLKQYITAKELNQFINYNINIYKNFLVENSRLTDDEITDIRDALGNKVTEREIRHLSRILNQIILKKVL